MREIKFRAWDSGVNQMIYPHSDGVANHLEVWEILRYFDVVMQYTGLKDKNGKEIYEGDIVNLWDFDGGPYVHKVSWEESGYFTLVPYMDGLGFIPTLGFFTNNEDCSDPYQVEIIGNIYENPELLEAK